LHINFCRVFAYAFFRGIPDAYSKAVCRHLQAVPGTSWASCLLKGARSRMSMSRSSIHCLEMPDGEHHHIICHGFAFGPSAWTSRPLLGDVTAARALTLGQCSTSFTCR
jgi:hypothetical protein